MKIKEHLKVGDNISFLSGDDKVMSSKIVELLLCGCLVDNDTYVLYDDITHFPGSFVLSLLN